MRRVEYYHQRDKPEANSLAPTVFAVVRDLGGRILLVRRMDTGNWELPGGRVEIGESATAAAVREVREESGVRIAVTRFAGLYTDPEYVMVYPGSGEARQQFAVCLHARVLGGRPRPDSEETSEAGWFEPSELPALPIHPSVRRRITDAITQPDYPHLG
jgi:ADP-ribose pyrophosphatase YjhB (NUDIX family)